MMQRYLVQKAKQELSELIDGGHSMTIEKSIALIFKQYGWQVDEGTLLILDAEMCLWIARVTTTRRTAGGQAELNFPILVAERDVFSDLDNSNLRALGEWCLRQEIAA
jgi:hypothetical protein